MKTIAFLLLFLSFTPPTIRSQTINELLTKADAENSKRNYLTAIKHYDEAIALEPNNGKLYLYRGQDYAMLNEFRKAEQDYSKAISLLPQSFDGYLSRAILYYTINRLEERDRKSVV